MDRVDRGPPRPEEGRARQLDKDHYDIDRIKERIIEFLAVRKLKPDARSSILCFVGPPGVGKTSLGKSIAAAIGPRVRAHLRRRRARRVGDPRPPPHLHRRDARRDRPRAARRRLEQPGPDDRRDRQDGRGLPRRPVERDARGARPRAEHAPSATTTSTCRSTSRTSCSSRTANQLDPIPAPLRDRMEIIELSGYTEEEKLEIAKRYLVPRQIERNGLTQEQDRDHRQGARADHRGLHARGRRAQPRAPDRRRLPQGRARVRRGHAQRASARSGPKAVRRAARPAHGSRATRTRRTDEPGVATGLAWTPVGGDVLFVEATAYPGEGKLHDHRPARRRDEGVGVGRAVVPEGERLALGRGASTREWFRVHDVHVHVPAGAVPKDGPSAGITMATALVSLVTGRPVRSDTAMTGEITLTGQVLPIGGLQGEGARRAARRRHARDRAEAERARLRRVPAVAEEATWSSSGSSTIDEVLGEALEQRPRPSGARKRLANGARRTRRRRRAKRR